MYPEKGYVHRSVRCSPVDNARTWKQPELPQTGMDKEGMVPVYNGILLCHKKK